MAILKAHKYEDPHTEALSNMRKARLPMHTKETKLFLVVVFQSSLDSGMAPTDWKVANVSPLFKKGK